MITREQQRIDWLNQQIALSGPIETVAGDASFRQYYRAYDSCQSYILMDAPVDKESCEPFLRVGQVMRDAHIAVPHCFAHDTQLGFVLLSDFGNDSLLSRLTPQTVDTYYHKAFSILTSLQAMKADLPLFDSAHILQECQLFIDWYLQKHCHVAMDALTQGRLEQVFSALASMATSQPQRVMHRDFHSRNLMVLADDSLGVLDFQDAMRGPITYDLVSLLRDCYIAWPDDKVRTWALAYRDKLDLDCPDKQWLQWFDWVGIQRHVKVLGIFSRLYYRDNKSGYLADIPQVKAYICHTAKRYPELEVLVELVENV